MNELIEHGHRDPKAYTPGQISLFLEAIARKEATRRREQRRERAIANRIAAYSKEDFTKEMRKLADPDN